ncbi:MAG: DUF192 domain-containing protein [Bryobacterales bacterium]
MTRKKAFSTAARLVAALACAAAFSCSPTASETGASPSGLSTMPVSYPDGTTIRAEVALNILDQARGLMFREDLPPDKGMLFVFMDEAERSFWMFRTKIPLDILWINANHQIVEISANTPPCPGERRDDCPSYGGNAYAQFVLEIAAGQAAAHNLKVGDRLNF